METVKIIQGQNEHGENVALFTPIHAVYVNSQERLDDTVENINTNITEFSASTTEQFNTYSAVTDSRIAELSATTDERFVQYKQNFDTYSGRTEEDINEIYNSVFKVTLTLETNTADIGNVTAKASTKQKGVPVSATTLTIGVKYKGGSEVNKYTGHNVSQSSVTTIPMSGCYFTVIANSTVPGRGGSALENSSSYTGYIYGYAVTTDGNFNHAGSIFSGNTTTKIIKNQNFTLTISSSLPEYYIWFFAPKVKGIESIKDKNGYTFSLADTQQEFNIQTGAYNGAYIAYRTLNMLTAASWPNISITLK